jgi:hypothetical protein
MIAKHLTCCLVCIFLLFQKISSQTELWPSFLTTAYDDSFAAWIIFNYDEEEIGTIELNTPMISGFTEWKFELGDKHGLIRQKWNDNPNTWEMIADNMRFTASTLFPNQFSTWTIDGTNLKKGKLESTGNGFYQTWKASIPSFSRFKVETTTEGDPRDWYADYAPEKNDIELAALFVFFIAVYHSTPKI